MLFEAPVTMAIRSWKKLVFMGLIYDEAARMEQIKSGRNG